MRGCQQARFPYGSGIGAGAGAGLVSVATAGLAVGVFDSGYTGIRVLQEKKQYKEI